MSQTQDSEQGVPVPEPDALYDKFRVERVDGRDKRGGDREQAKYFVLDYAQDPYAAPAILAYVDACEAKEPGLARDLLRALARELHRRAS